jgi:hypothetical protein
VEFWRFRKAEGGSIAEDAMNAIERHFEEVDAWERGDDMRVPAELLAQRGFTVQPRKEMSESRLRRALKELIEELAAINLYLDATDHLSDAELYDAICRDVLPRRYSLAYDWAVHDFVADEDGFEARMAYYADERTRASYAEWNEVPARRALPYDRDRHLPRPNTWEMCRLREYVCAED